MLLRLRDPLLRDGNLRGVRAPFPDCTEPEPESRQGGFLRTAPRCQDPPRSTAPPVPVMCAAGSPGGELRGGPRHRPPSLNPAGGFWWTEGPEDCSAAINDGWSLKMQSRSSSLWIALQSRTSWCQDRHNTENWTWTSRIRTQTSWAGNSGGPC